MAKVADITFEQLDLDPEDPGWKLFALELWRDESLAWSQLDLALERLSHRIQAYSGFRFTGLVLVGSRAGEEARAIARLVERRFRGDRLDRGARQGLATEW